MKKIIPLLLVTFLMVVAFVACDSNTPNVEKYYLDSNGNLIAEYDNGSTVDLGSLKDTIANGAQKISVNADGYYVINDVQTAIKAKLPVSYSIDTNGNLIVSYSDDTTENLGKFGNDSINTIGSISISDDGFYILNGIKTSIVAIETYDVTFDTGFSVNVSKQTIKDGYKVERPQIERTGYTLDGWYCNGEEWHFNSDVVKSDMLLVANWSANEYTVSLDSKGAEDYDSIKVKSGEFLTLPTPTLSLYTFDGWFDTNTEIKSGVFNYAKDLNLIAKYHRTQYRISFNSNGGNTVSPIMVDSFSTINELPVPVRNEYEFLGWFVDDIKIELPYDFTEGNITLVAKWRGISEDYDFVEEESGVGIKLLNYKGDDEYVTVPKTLGGKPVTTVAVNCFKDKTAIKTIAFNSNVVNFEFKSIVNCNALESLVISSDLEIDIVYLFGGEDNIPLTLKNIYFCEGSINANSSFFNNLTYRTFELWINNDLKVLKENAFYRCNSISKLHLNEGLEKIERTAIWQMSALTFVNIPSTVTDIGSSNFGNCSNLLYLIVPKTIKNTTSQSLVASNSVVLVEYESFPSTWDSLVFGYDVTSSRMTIFYGFERLVETDKFLYALCKVGSTKRCVIIQRFDSSEDYPEYLDEYPVVFTNNNYTAPKD